MSYTSVLRYLREMVFRMDLAEDMFRKAAYRRAADAVTAAGCLDVGWDRLPGVGKSIRSEIECVISGAVPERLVRLRESGPPESAMDLTAIPGIGVKRIGLLSRAGINSVDDLAAAIRRCEVSDPTLVRSFYAFRAARGVVARSDLVTVADQLTAVLTQAGAQAADVVGSYRRCRPDLRDIELLAAVPNDTVVRRVLNALRSAYQASPTAVADGIYDFEVPCCGLSFPVRLHFCPADAYGLFMARLTGSTAYWDACVNHAAELGIAINTETITIEGVDYVCPTEQVFFDALGLAVLDPRQREAASLEPRASAPMCVVADLHVHTTASSGINTAKQVQTACTQLGYKAVGICDNIRDFGHGVRSDAISKHKDTVKDACTGGIPTLVGAEIDIRIDGSLDCGDVLGGLKYAILAINNEPGRNTMQRYADAVKAVRDAMPKMPIAITRPGNREIGRRLDVDIDWRSFYRMCGNMNVAVDINGDPCRADPADSIIAIGRDFRCKFLASSNAKSTAQLGKNMNIALDLATRASLDRSDVLNASAASLQHWLAGGDLRRLG